MPSEQKTGEQQVPMSRHCRPLWVDLRSEALVPSLSLPDTPAVLMPLDSRPDAPLSAGSKAEAEETLPSPWLQPSPLYPHHSVSASVTSVAVSDDKS